MLKIKEKLNHPRDSSWVFNIFGDNPKNFRILREKDLFLCLLLFKFTWFRGGFSFSNIWWGGIESILGGCSCSTTVSFSFVLSSCIFDNGKIYRFIDWSTNWKTIYEFVLTRFWFLIWCRAINYETKQHKKFWREKKAIIRNAINVVCFIFFCPEDSEDRHR